MRALEGIVVLDLTHMLSGPYGTMLLADLGARTIKIESPGKGEGTRRLLETSEDYARNGNGAYFLTLCRNKESVAIDVKNEAGAASKRISTRRRCSHWHRGLRRSWSSANSPPS